MNSYILQVEEHKTLLAQNRIDPITGDKISEGDEVVFCAGCKSIFLKDTWEYLGGKHCNQTNTLKYIPVSSAKLKLGNDILYYQPTKNIKSTEVEITPLMKNWVYKENDTGKFHKYFFGEEELNLKATFYIISFIVFLILNITLKNALFFLLSLIFVMGFYPFLKDLKIGSYKKNLTNGYKNITEQSFLIKPNGIAVCSAYGIKEVFLHSEKLTAITLSDLGIFFKSEVVFEYGNDKRIRIPLANHLSDGNFSYFLKALAKLSIGLDFPIMLYIKDEEKIKYANQLIEEMKAKFTIESRDEYLRKNYGYLYNYANKIQKLFY